MKTGKLRFTVALRGTVRTLSLLFLASYSLFGTKVDISVYFVIRGYFRRLLQPQAGIENAQLCCKPSVTQSCSFKLSFLLAV
jgi:hypothetical protein